ncbi:MAG TPA: peptide chain release factor N(5)-glutamine methyltransferase [Ohtaekwangia sp.]
MSNSKELFEDFVSGIKLNETREEVCGIARLVFEDLFSISHTDLISGKPFHPSAEETSQLKHVQNRINQGEPVQYVLGHAFFYGRKFSVNPSVLIPRPETEELVNQLLMHTPLQSVLDIGTGSGCIPITIACENPGVSIYATDISIAALTVAGRNAANLKAKVEFWEHDILTQEIPFTNLDVVTSNPPYIAESEKKTMRPNVVDHEPHLALFVSDDDPLLFYRTIASKARTSLRAGGAIIFEINERFGNEVASLLSDNHYRNISLVKDLSGKDRIVKGIL